MKKFINFKITRNSMKKQGVKSVLALLIIFSLCLIINSSNVESANTVTIDGLTSGTCLTPLALTDYVNFSATLDTNTGVSNCSWFSSTDGVTWTIFNSTVNGSDDALGYGTHARDISGFTESASTYINVTCYANENGDFATAVTSDANSGLVVDVTIPTASIKSDSPPLIPAFSGLEVDLSASTDAITPTRLNRTILMTYKLSKSGSVKTVTGTPIVRTGKYIQLKDGYFSTIDIPYNISVMVSDACSNYDYDEIEIRTGSQKKGGEDVTSPTATGRAVRTLGLPFLGIALAVLIIILVLIFYYNKKKKG